MLLDELVAGLRSPRDLDPDTRADLDAALGRIPRRYRKLLVTHYNHGYSVRAAMRLTGSRSHRDYQLALLSLLKEMKDA